MAAVATPRKTAQGETGSGFWWGPGGPPGELWPGVTVPIQAVWSSRNGRWESHSGRYFFDADAASKACDFFPDLLKHHIGEFAGLPFVLMEYQTKLQTRPIFGWKRSADGWRRFRKMFGFIPKGGGKSPWAAATGIYLARLDDEAAAEVYAVANDREQARTVHDNAKIMIEDSPLLSDGCVVLKNSIYWAASRSAYVVLSSDASTAHGKRPHGVLFDEMHAQKNRDLYEALKKSLAKRRQPLMIIITHAGDDDEGICYEEYEYAKGVLGGLIPDETCLPIIFEMAPKDDWTDPEVWRRVNPGHGITVKHDAIEQECLEAQHEPRKLNDFLRFHGNRWTNQATAWIPIDWWDACEGVLDDAELVTLECAAGLDLAQKWDLACCAVVFRKYLESATEVEVVTEETTGAVTKRTIALNYQLFVRPFFWIPENTMRQHEKEDGVPYTLWSNQTCPGTDIRLVTPTDGDIIDYNRIYQDITTKILPRYPKLKQGTIGYDPAFATDIATKLRDLAGLQILEVLQNYKMFSEPSQIVEALIKGKRVVHDGHRVLRWNWENAAVKTDDAGRIRPVKPRNASKRVDGAVAMIMGDKVLSMQQPPKEPEYQMIFLSSRA